MNTDWELISADETPKLLGGASEDLGEKGIGASGGKPVG